MVVELLHAATLWQADNMDVTERNRPQWRPLMQRTGIWWEPHPWPEQHVEGLTLGRADLDAALAALRRLYDSDVARRIFADRGQPTLAQMLTDGVLPRHSKLLALGTDLVDAAPWGAGYGDLLGKLRVDENYRGARFELSLLAAMRRAQIEFEYEPLRDRGGSNPDFAISTRDRTLIVDAKAAGPSQLVRDDDAWHHAMLWGADGYRNPDGPLPVILSFTDRVDELQPWQKRALTPEVRAVAQRMIEGGVAPAKEIVGDTVIVEVNGRGASGVLERPNHTKEASRVVANLIAENATQIPPDREGGFFIALGQMPDVRKTRAEVVNWLNGPGLDYPQIEYVFLFAHTFIGHLLRYVVVPVGRGPLPDDVKELATAILRNVGFYHRAIDSAAVEDAVALLG